MAKAYTIQTIENKGEHDQIIDLRVSGLYITVFTFPNGRRSVWLHDTDNHTMTVEKSETCDTSVEVVFRK